MSTETQRVTLRPFGYSGQSRVGSRDGTIPYTLDSVNMDTHRSEPWGSRGYQIHRLAAASTVVPCSSFFHTHSDGGSTPVYWVGAKLLAETGSDSPTPMNTGLTGTYKPIWVTMDTPAGMSVVFNGTNGQALLVREDGSNGLEAVLLDFVAPADYTSLLTTPNTGSLIAGTYHVAIVYEDNGGSVLVQSAPTFVKNVAVAVNDSINIDISTLVHPARATHWSVYVAVPGTSGDVATDAGSSYLQAIDSQAIASETVSITSVTGLVGLTHINETMRQATLPLTGIDGAWLHDGRVFVSSSISNKVYFSERDNPNHWYSINEITAGAESGWSAGVVGGISAFGSCYIYTRRSVHRVYGSLTRDDQGTGASFILDVNQDQVWDSFGLVGPNAITHVGAYVYFYSDQGLAMQQGNSIRLVMPVDEQGILDRLDVTYLDRIVLAEDPNGYVCVLAPRLTNTARPIDGASIAGVADRIYRWDYRHGLWACPLAYGDLTHIVTRQNGAFGTTSAKNYLMASNPYGYVLQLGKGWSGGGALVVTGAEYDGQLCTTSQATTATWVEAGISADAYNGMTLALFYPTGDTGFAGLWGLKTIIDTTISGSNVTVTWAGSLTVPSASGAWTARVAGLPCVGDISFDLGRVVQVPPGQKIRIKGVRLKYAPMIGVEAVS